MKNRPQLKRSLGLRRPVYRTLQGWALGILIDQGAVVECDYHGHRIDRADPDAWNRAGRRLGGTRSPVPTRKPALPQWKTSCARSATPVRSADSGLHIPSPPPILILSSIGGVSSWPRALIGRAFCGCRS